MNFTTKYKIIGFLIYSTLTFGIRALVQNLEPRAYLPTQKFKQTPPKKLNTLKLSKIRYKSELQAPAPPDLQAKNAITYYYFILHKYLYINIMPNWNYYNFFYILKVTNNKTKISFRTWTLVSISIWFPLFIFKSSFGQSEFIYIVL